MTTLDAQITGDLTRLQGSAFGGMVGIVVNDGSTSTTVQGWWREIDAGEEIQERGIVQVRRAMAWVRTADLADPGRYAKWALESDAATVFDRNEPPRDDGYGLWVMNLARKATVELSLARHRRGMEA